MVELIRLWTDKLWRASWLVCTEGIENWKAKLFIGKQVEEWLYTCESPVNKMLYPQTKEFSACLYHLKEFSTTKMFSFLLLFPLVSSHSHWTLNCHTRSTSCLVYKPILLPLSGVCLLSFKHYKDRCPLRVIIKLLIVFSINNL